MPDPATSEALLLVREALQGAAESMSLLRRDIAEAKRKRADRERKRHEQQQPQPASAGGPA